MSSLTPQEWLRRYDAWWGSLTYAEQSAANELTMRELGALLAAVATYAKHETADEKLNWLKEGF